MGSFEARFQGPKGRSTVGAARARVVMKANKISERKAKRDFSSQKPLGEEAVSLRSK